jgi:hypothetical protein
MGMPIACLDLPAILFQGKARHDLEESPSDPISPRPSSRLSNQASVGQVVRWNDADGPACNGLFSRPLNEAVDGGAVGRIGRRIYRSGLEQTCHRYVAEAKGAQCAQKLVGLNAVKRINIKYPSRTMRSFRSASSTGSPSLDYPFGEVI